MPGLILPVGISCAKKENNNKPDILILLADDMGYGETESERICLNIDQLY
jgi:hypothetical protein